MLVFASLVPHPPIILPNVASPKDQAQVNQTILSMEKLASKLAKAKPDTLVISSPHPDWGFNVPLHFLTKNLLKIRIKTFLTDLKSPQVHFEKGKEITKSLSRSRSTAWIASGDMSHRLKEDGPYGLHPSGDKFDQKFIKLLKRKDVRSILNLPEQLVEEAAECGLRSFCMALGAIEQAKVNWQPEILSYQAPFGVGYLVVNLNVNKK